MRKDVFQAIFTKPHETL